jgi:adenosyl cobinamide kinase/adenosyl cobinamide phosphate guanylyltransferase
MSVPQLVLLNATATTRTAATVAASNIQTRMGSAFNSMLQAWESARSTMWSTSTDPQDVVDALGVYAGQWFALFDTLQEMINDYVLAADAEPSFTHPDYVATTNSDGTVTITGTLDASAD